MEEEKLGGRTLWLTGQKGICCGEETEKGKCCCRAQGRWEGCSVMGKGVLRSMEHTGNGRRGFRREYVIVKEQRKGYAVLRGHEG